MANNSSFHVLTCIFNPQKYKSRTILFNKWLEHMLESSVSVHVIECSQDEHFTIDYSNKFSLVRVHSKTTLWIKENLLNILLKTIPDSAEQIGIFDADIEFQNEDWVLRIQGKLQEYPVVQAWRYCYDLGPNNKPMIINSLNETIHESYGYYYKKFGCIINEMQKYAHPGYAWAFRRETLDQLGGLFEYGILGGADRNMANCFIKKPKFSFNESEQTKAFIEFSKPWVNNAVSVVNGNIGYVNCTLKHGFHGYKANRNYIERKQILIRNEFDPVTDLIKNSDGVLEFAGNKPNLEKELEQYFVSRDEDIHLR